MSDLQKLRQLEMWFGLKINPCVKYTNKLMQKTLKNVISYNTQIKQ